MASGTATRSMTPCGFAPVTTSDNGTPQHFEKTGPLPVQNVLVHRTGAAKVFSRERFPLAAGSEHENNGFETTQERSATLSAYYGQVLKHHPARRTRRWIVEVAHIWINPPPYARIDLGGDPAGDLEARPPQPSGPAVRST